VDGSLTATSVTAFRPRRWGQTGRAGSAVLHPGRGFRKVFVPRPPNTVATHRTNTHNQAA